VPVVEVKERVSNTSLISPTVSRSADLSRPEIVE